MSLCRHINLCCYSEACDGCVEACGVCVEVCDGCVEACGGCVEWVC